MPYESPEAAYEGFFYHFNREDSIGWATVMSYPHTRVSSQGRRTWFETPETTRRSTHGPSSRKPAGCAPRG